MKYRINPSYRLCPYFMKPGHAGRITLVGRRTQIANPASVVRTATVPGHFHPEVVRAILNLWLPQDAVA